MKKSEEQLFMTKLRTEILHGDMVSTMKKACVLRVVRYFPKNGNQQDKRIWIYNKYGHIISVFDNVQYLSVIGLRNLLPKRVFIIEDDTYSDKKSFEYWDCFI